MIGIVVVTHFGLGEYFIEIAEKIVGERPKNMVAVSVDPEKDVNSIRQELMSSLKKVDSKEGVLILTDMFGGTPCNMSLAFFKEGEIEVLTGLNLPILIEIIGGRHEGKSLNDLALYLQSIGQKNIYLASEILSKKPGSVTY